MLKSRMLGSLAAAAMLVSLTGVATMAQESKPPAPTQDKAPSHEKDKAKEKSKDGDKGGGNGKDGAKEKGVQLHAGDSAPDFSGKDLNGKEHKLSDLTKAGKTVVLVWFNPDCPYVKKHFENGNNTFQKMADAFKDKEVVLLAVNSGAKGKQGAGAERNAKATKDWSITVPIILDEAGVIGKAYGAKNSPATYVISKTGSVAYVGAICDDSGGSGVGKTLYAVKAVEELLAGKPVTLAETKPYGCGVKYAD